MNTEPIANRCPKCQALLPSNAPQGLCVKCLLAAVSTPTEAGQPADRKPPPTIATVAAAFPQLEILELIGHGGMGVVYKARQPNLDRLVALKLLPQSLAADAAFAERFNREARVLARLNHPNIVTVYDFGQSGGFFFLLMELVDGVNLRQAMQAGRFTPQQAMMLVPKICEALQFAHDEGILHRDIKPENILLDTKGRVKIADFGIAKLVGEARENITLTASGLAVGTPHYMAPEQLEHPQDVDQRADIYSLGVVFYEMLTGELPIGRFAPPSHKSDVDARVDEVVFHALEKEREKRFRSAGEVKTSVEAITARSTANPARPAPQPSGQNAPCYFNTPARMRDCFPSTAARIFTCKGELALDAENLTFTSTWRTVITIPLKNIEDLSVGQFQMWTTPWVTKYARINFLSVTFRREGQSQTVHLTPVEPGANTEGKINDSVGKWFDLVRQVAVARTGSAPHCSEPESLTIKAQKAWGRIGWPLYILFMLVWFGSWFVLPSITHYRPPQPIWTILAIVTGLLAAATLFSAAGFMKADRALKRGDLDAVTSDDPPSPEPAGADTGRSPGMRRLNVSYLGLAVAALVLVLLAGWWSFSHSPAPPSGETSGDSSTRADMAATPEPESRFVLYTMPPQGTNAPGVLRWKFKCLVPAHHLARVLFVFWTNGVPTVHKDFSTYVKVGNAPIDNDFYLSCERIAAAASQTQTNLVIWHVGLRAGGGGLVLEFPGQPAYLPMKTPAHMTVRSGHQGILRLVDYVGQDGQSTYGQSGVELRIFLEPIKYAPVRTDPFETEGPNYVAGLGPGWTTDEALEAIREWPAEPPALLPKPARAAPFSRKAVKPAITDPVTNVVLLTMPTPHARSYDIQVSHFKCLLPAHHMARVLFVRWTNGVPEVWDGLCAYFKVGIASISADFFLSCQSLTGAPATNVTNDVQWTVNLFGRGDRIARLPHEPRHRAVELPTQLVVRSRHQGILRLADHLGPDGKPTPNRSGIELRIFLEPLQNTPLRINPSELEGPNYVAEGDPGWTSEQALKAIQEWPIDQ